MSPLPMQLVETIEDLKALRASSKAKSIAFVPTMGALHPGHLSLIQKAQSLAQQTWVSIYVNPLQFGPREDFSRYPRTREEDLALCEANGVDVVFYPHASELHPQGYEAITQVLPPSQITEQLCGLFRPGHFTGVATIVLKLFNLVQPHYAVFGQKDAQQLAVIQRMVSDLDVPVTIVPAPTFRETDGLAMSSRNRYLQSASDRQQARLLFRVLTTVQELYRQGVETTETAFTLARQRVLDEQLYPDFELEYLAAVDAKTFLPVEVLSDETRILMAAQVGQTRLIDNILLSEVPWIPTASGEAPRPSFKGDTPPLQREATAR